MAEAAASGLGLSCLSRSGSCLALLGVRRGTIPRSSRRRYRRILFGSPAHDCVIPYSPHCYLLFSSAASSESCRRRRLWFSGIAHNIFADSCHARSGRRVYILLLPHLFCRLRRCWFCCFRSRFLCAFLSFETTENHPTRRSKRRRKTARLSLVVRPPSHAP